MSYPRTGSRYISEDVFEEMPERIALLERYPCFAGYAAGLDGATLNRRSVNDGKVTDHHALIVTENLPGELSKDERAIYEMVAGRMLEAFSGKCVKDVTTVLLSAGDGAVMKTAGWRAVFSEQDTEDEDTATLPPLQEGQALPLSGVDLLEKQTKPKPLHIGGYGECGQGTGGCRTESQPERYRDRYASHTCGNYRDTVCPPVHRA